MKKRNMILMIWGMCLFLVTSLIMNIITHDNHGIGGEVMLLIVPFIYHYAIWPIIRDMIIDTYCIWTIKPGRALEAAEYAKSVFEAREA